jgi:hypothetical protein
MKSLNITILSIGRQVCTARYPFLSHYPISGGCLKEFARSACLPFFLEILLMKFFEEAILPSVLDVKMVFDSVRGGTCDAKPAAVRGGKMLTYGKNKLAPSQESTRQVQSQQ